MTTTIHHLLAVALIIPFLALSLGVILASFGIAWFAHVPKSKR